MKKMLSAVLAVVVVCATAVPSVFSAGRWEKGLKFTGWFSNTIVTNTLQWRTGVQTQIKRTDAFSVWDNGIIMNYGEAIVTSLLGSRVSSMDPNLMLVYTTYVRNLNAFNSWQVYVGYGSRVAKMSQSNTDFPTIDLLNYASNMDSWLGYFRIINRYLTLNMRVRSAKNIDPEGSIANSLGIGSSYNRPIGYRTKIIWNLNLYGNLGGGNNKIESILNYNYKLGKKMSLVFGSTYAVDPNNTAKPWRIESFDLVYDLLYSGGSTY